MQTEGGIREDSVDWVVWILLVQYVSIYDIWGVALNQPPNHIIIHSFT